MSKTPPNRRFMVPAKLLAIGLARGGKQEPAILKNIHVRGGVGGRQVIEATNTRLLYVVENSTGNSEQDFSMEHDALLTHDMVDAILAKAGDELVEISTRMIESGTEGNEARYRETTIGLQDETTIVFHSAADSYPDYVDARLDMESHRDCHTMEFDQVTLLKGLKLIRQCSEVDNVSVRVPIMDPLAPIALIAENGRQRHTALVNPLGELRTRVAVRWSKIVVAMCDAFEAANQDAELGVSQMEMRSLTGRLRELARQAMQNVATRTTGEKAPDPQQVLFDELRPMVEAEKKKAEAEAKKKKGAETQDMLGPRDENVVDSNERQVARPEDDEADVDDDDEIEGEESDDDDVDESTGVGMTDEEFEESAKPKGGRKRKD